MLAPVLMTGCVSPQTGSAQTAARQQAIDNAVHHLHSTFLTCQVKSQGADSECSYVKSCYAHADEQQSPQT